MSPRWKQTSPARIMAITPRKGCLVLESKDEMKSRGVDSPDLGDALAMTFAVKIAPKTPKGPETRADSGGRFMDGIEPQFADMSFEDRARVKAAMCKELVKDVKRKFPHKTGRVCHELARTLVEKALERESTKENHGNRHN